MNLNLPEITTQSFYTDMSKLIPIRIEDMEQELLEQAERFTTVVREHAQTIGELAKLQIELDNVKADRYLGLRSQEDRPTEKEAEAMVTTTTEVKQFRMQIADLQERKAFLDGMVKAMDNRNTMLVNINKRLLNYEGSER